MSVFDVFCEFLTDYTYLELGSTANGYEVVGEHVAQGIPKIIEGQTEADAMEQATSDAKLKIKVDESFLPEEPVKDLLNHGISLHSVTYRIDGVSLAQDGDFYNLNLVREDFVWDESPSPLE